MTKRLVVAVVVTLLAVGASAQMDPMRPTPKLPLGDTLLAMPTTHMPGAGIWELRFTHRFNEPLNRGAGHTLLGLDSNAEIVFGLSYVVHDNVQLSLHRSNANDTLEGAARWVVLQQGSMPFSAALRGGADWRTEQNLNDRSSFFAQAILSHQFGRVAEISIVPTYVTKAGRAVEGDSSGALFAHTFNVPVTLAWMVRPAVGIVGEIIPPNSDLPDEIDSVIGWSLGLKYNIGAHWFELLVTNNQSTLTDQWATSTYQGGPLNSGDMHLGFNIERRFGHKR
jgi:hypothetical protein